MPRKPPAADEAAGKTQHIEVASIAGTSEDDVAALRARVAELTEQLGAARSDAEQRALAQAEAQAVFSPQSEVATGKTITISRCAGYKTVGYRDNGQPIKKPVWEDAEEPTYFYKINLPPVGGEGLLHNGVPLQHGTVYEMDIHTLRTVKDQVFRLWQHDQNVFGMNENAYRRERAPVLSGKGL